MSGMMGWLNRILYGNAAGDHHRPMASSFGDEVVFGGGGNDTGVRVDADTALKISTVYACVGLLAETIAGLPMVIYEYMDDSGSRRRAREHPLYEVLHNKPNHQQTTVEFVEMMQLHALLRGAGYAEIRPGGRGWGDQLIPLHADYVNKELLPNGRYRYQVTDMQGRQRTLAQEYILELGGISPDGGLTRMSPVSYAATAFGMTLGAERYGARFFKNDSRPSGVLRTDKDLRGNEPERVRADWERLHSGANQHRVAVLAQGLQWQPIGITPEEAQFLQTREFQAEDVCRWFRVPPHMVGLTAKTTSWGTGIEQMGIGFVTYTLRPWLNRWAQAIQRSLLMDERYFVDFVVEALLRGDIGSRYNAYRTGRDGGWLSINEIRRMENMNPVDGGDTYLQPLNMAPVGTTAAAHRSALAEEAAGRLVRKEQAAMSRAWERCDGDRTAWAAEVINFYGDHVALVAQSMRIPLDAAAAYCRDGQSSLLKADGENVLGLIRSWLPDRVTMLAHVAIEGNDHGNDSNGIVGNQG